MSAAILPDGSVVVRLPSHTVHVDIRTRAIHLRAASSRDELAGSILESFPLTAVDRVRLIRDDAHEHALQLALRSGRCLPLGVAPTHELALMTARIVADVTRCKVEIAGDGPQALPGASEAFSSSATVERYFAELTPIAPELIKGDDGVDPPTNRILMRGVVTKGAIRDRFPAPRTASQERQRLDVDEFPTEPPDRRAPSMPPKPVQLPTVEPDPQDMDEDPLDITMCREASEDEYQLRIPAHELVGADTCIEPLRDPTYRRAQEALPPVTPSAISEEGSDPTHIAKTRLRLRPESWLDMHEERDATMEDAFDVRRSDWEDGARF